MDIKEELRKYKEMLDEGLITQDDFEKLKNKLLELGTSSVKTEEDDPFKSFKEKNNADTVEAPVKNEASKESKKADIDTSWLHEEYLIPPSSAGNSAGYGSTVQNNSISNKGGSIHIEDKPTKKRSNGFCIAGGALGVIAALIINPFCIIAVLGLIFSIIGLVACKKKEQPGTGYAITGIILSAFAIVLFFVSVFTSITLFGWMNGTNLPIGRKSGTSAIVDTGKTSGTVDTEKASNIEPQKESNVSQQEQPAPSATLPDFTGNWKVDNVVFPDGTSIRGYNTTVIDIKFNGLSYVMDFPELNVSTGGDLSFIGSYSDKCSVYNSSQDGTDSVVYFDGMLYMKLKLRDNSNNDVMGYYVLVREGESGLGTLTTEDVKTLFATMDSVIVTVRDAVK